jgi:hypothetical protein
MLDLAGGIHQVHPLSVKFCVEGREPCTVVLFLSGALMVIRTFKKKYDLLPTLQQLEQAHANSA